MPAIRRLLARVTGRKVQRPLALMYHRVTDLDNDIWDLAVSPKNFDEQIDVLSRTAYPLKASEFASTLMTGLLPPNAVSVTFDDGYADNFNIARRQLEKYEVPATFFVVSGSIGENREFWWDQIEQLIFHCPALPDVIHVEVDAHRFTWKNSETLDARAHEANGDERSRKMSLYTDLWSFMYGMPGAEQLEIIGALERQIGRQLTCRLSHEVMSRGQLESLSEENLFEIGAHTVTHPPLGRLSAESQYREMRHCKIALNEWLSRETTVLSYPHGDYSLRTVEGAREAGYTAAFATGSKAALPSSGAYSIPRLHVPNVNGEAFEEWLRRHQVHHV